jgi:sugar phosphate isomerase/epimerase
MDIVCASICYRGYADDEVTATLEGASKLGYRLMEIHGPMTWSVEAVEHLDLEGLKARIARSGLKCAGIYSPGWGGANDAEVLSHARAIAKCAAYVEALGGDHVVSTGAGGRQQHKDALARVIQCVQEALKLVSPSNPVRLALEPHRGNVLEQAKDFRQVMDAVADRRVGLCVDNGHFHSAGVNTVAFIREFGPRIYNVHLKDHMGTESVGIGRGEINLAEEIDALREIKYAGDLTVELEVKDPQNLPRYTQEAYTYLSGMLGRKL